jgi:outer membrane protein TolC
LIAASTGVAWAGYSLITGDQTPVSGERSSDESLADDDWSLEELTMAQCIKIGLQRSPSIRMAALDLKTSELNVKDAWANYLPEIDASGQYRFSDSIDWGWERQNYDAQISASYTIWDHGRREAGLAQAKASEKGVQTDYERTKQTLIFNITQAYYDLLKAEKLIDINEKLLEISKGNVEKVTAFQEAGRSIPSDVATARVQQANDELALINAKNSFELARANLASLMGLDPGTPIGIYDDPDYEKYTKEVLLIPEVSLEDSMAVAIQERPEMIRLKTRLTSLEWSLKLARLNRWPVLTADYGLNVLLDDYLRDRDNFKKYRNWSVAARISFPIFDGGASRRRELSAEIAVDQMKEDIGERKRAISLEVQQAYLSLERSQKSLDIAREQVIDATESLNVTQGRYEQDMVIFLEILSAQAGYARALINQVEAFYDFRIAEKALQKAVGTLKVED